VKTGEYLEHDEGLGQKMDGNIRKAPQPPLKFEVAQQNQFLRNAHKALDDERVREELERTTQRSLEQAKIWEEVQRETQRTL
jgi:hypothetical protein